MIYVKPRRVDPKRAKRYLARTTPDKIVTYVNGEEMQKLIEDNNLYRVGETVQPQIVFSLLMGHWLDRMKIKHADNPYARTQLYVEYQLSWNGYRLEGVHR